MRMYTLHVLLQVRCILIITMATIETKSLFGNIVLKRNIETNTINLYYVVVTQNEAFYFIYIYIYIALIIRIHYVDAYAIFRNA